LLWSRAGSVPRTKNVLERQKRHSSHLARSSSSTLHSKEETLPESLSPLEILAIAKCPLSRELRNLDKSLLAFMSYLEEH
jgi:hypothetical protein